MRRSFKKGMPRRLLQVLALCLLLALALAGCGGKQETEAQLLETFTNLLARDYEVYYLFYSGGMPTKAESAFLLGSVTYYPADSPQYKNLDSLQKLLEKTYARPTEIRDLLNRTSQLKSRIFIEHEGKLYALDDENATYFPYDLVQDSIRIYSRTENTVIFLFEERGVDGTRYETTLAMTRQDGGGWLLESQLISAPRAAIAGPGEEELFVPGEARQAAEEFLAALVAGDTAAIETLSGADPNTYDSWKELEVSAGVITRAVEDLDMQGEYLADLTVVRGGGILEEGEVSYRLKVGMSNASYSMTFGDSALGLSVDYFQPEALAAYELLPEVEKQRLAAYPVDSLLGLFGVLRFDEPSQLEAEQITEFVLTDLMRVSGSFMESFTLAQVQAGAESLFGIAGFAPGGSFLSPEGDYRVGGRGLRIPRWVILCPEPEDGAVAVEVREYSDPLKTQLMGTVRYTMQENPGGGWRFLSAVAVNEQLIVDN